MNYERSKAPLALMEQIIMILVFALAAAVCLQAFVYANGLSTRGEKKNFGEKVKKIIVKGTPPPASERKKEGRRVEVEPLVFDFLERNM